MENPPHAAQDLVTVAQFLVPTDAFVACGCLQASGVPAVVADANHAQADQLIAPAMGGVRVLVPPEWLERAEAVMAAYERGEFALGDDADVGTASAE